MGLGFAAVARIAQHTHFVLHLHRQHGVLLAVGFTDMAHQGAIGARVGVAACLAEGAEQFDALAALEANPRIALVVLLYPIGRVARKAVLPATEPQQHELEVVAPGFLKDAIHQRELESALLAPMRRPPARS